MDDPFENRVENSVMENSGKGGGIKKKKNTSGFRIWPYYLFHNFCFPWSAARKIGNGMGFEWHKIKLSNTTGEITIIQSDHPAPLSKVGQFGYV